VADIVEKNVPTDNEAVFDKTQVASTDNEVVFDKTHVASTDNR
jgi:hypothetical protein